MEVVRRDDEFVIIKNGDQGAHKCVPLEIVFSHGYGAIDALEKVESGLHFVETVLRGTSGGGRELLPYESLGVAAICEGLGALIEGGTAGNRDVKAVLRGYSFE